MIRSAFFASALALALPAGAALAQEVVPVRAIAGTRLDIVATGEKSPYRTLTGGLE